MIGQFRMFDADPPRFARARRIDPRSSHEAAGRVERTGSAKRQAGRVLAAFHRFPMATTGELAEYAHLNRVMVARRAPELERAGLLKRYDPNKNTKVCAVTGYRCIRWRPA